jgi:hypothetical protein
MKQIPNQFWLYQIALWNSSTWETQGRKLKFKESNREQENNELFLNIIFF